jgi:HlyD family secretion protein
MHFFRRLIVNNLRAFWSVPLIAGLLLATVLQAQNSPRDDVAGQSLAQDRIENTVRESGVVESADVVELRSPIHGAVLQLPSSGELVKTGDLLAVLDTAELDQQLQELAILAAEAQSKVVEYNAEREAMQATAQLLATQAAGQRKLTELVGQSLTSDDGELALQQLELESALRLAEHRLTATREVIRAVQLATVPDSPDVARARFDLSSAEEQLKLAQLRRDYFIKYERPKRTTESELAIAKLNLQATQEQLAAQAHLQALEANLNAAKVALQQAEERLTRAQALREASHITAPREGLALLVSPRRSGAADAGLQIGDVVRQGQTLIRLADPGRLQMHVPVNESRIQRVRTGQRATIRLDALPDREYSGQVTMVHDVPQPTSWLAEGVKNYLVVVSIEKADNAIRLGMTGQVTIATGPSDGE